MPSPLRFRWLDPLRGVAALWVFAVHFPFFESVEKHAPGLKAFFDRGHLGVPMFFVISGFCLLAAARHAQANELSAWRFLFRRLYRIFPPLWFSVVVVVAIPYVIEGISYLKTRTYVSPDPPFAEFGFGEWVRYLTLTQAFAGGYKDLPTKFTALNIVYWSLAIEVQFYVVMAIALACRERMIQLLSFVTIASLVAAADPSTFDSGFFLPYWPMFALGLGLYVALERQWTLDRWLGRAAPVCSFALAIVALAAIALSTLYHRHPAAYLLFALSFALLLWVAWPLESWAEPFAKTILGKVSFGLGLTSYSIYLLHAKLSFLTSQFVRQVLSTESLLFPPIAIGLTLVVCAGFYWCCERPFTGGGKRRLPSGVSPAHDPLRGPHVPVAVSARLSA